MAKLRILGEDDVRAAIDGVRALALARETLRDQAEGRSILSTPSAISLDARPFGGGRFKFKAATVGHLGMSGVRLISRRSSTDPAPCNYTALYGHDGALAGLVEELWLSRIRTAAFGAAVIEHLVNPGPLVVALFGAGRIAHEMVPILGNALPVAELRVNSRRAETVSAFIAAHASNVAFPMRAEANRTRTVQGADVVITITDSPTPLVFADSLKPGVVVCSMGGRNEVDYGVLLASRRLIVDDPDWASEVGDGGAWIAEGRLTREQFERRIDALACEVAGGKKPGRLAAADRILAIVQGMAIGDIAFAACALREAERLGRGTLVDLP